MNKLGLVCVVAMSWVGCADADHGESRHAARDNTGAQQLEAEEKEALEDGCTEVEQGVWECDDAESATALANDWDELEDGSREWVVAAPPSDREDLREQLAGAVEGLPAESDDDGAEDDALPTASDDDCEQLEDGSWECVDEALPVEDDDNCEQLEDGSWECVDEEVAVGA